MPFVAESVIPSRRHNNNRFVGTGEFIKDIPLQLLSRDCKDNMSHRKCYKCLAQSNFISEQLNFTPLMTRTEEGLEDVVDRSMLAFGILRRYAFSILAKIERSKII